MSADAFIGEIFMFGGNFAIRNFAFCEGQLLAINANQSLFSLLGTIYGGDGRTTFGLPDLRGRVPIHQGNGPGLSNRPIGQKSGQENVTLVESQMPSHTHTLRANNAEGDTNDPTGAALAKSGTGGYTSVAPNQSMRSDAVLSTGSGQSHNNMQPYIAVSFIIALFGIFPSRN